MFKAVHCQSNGSCRVKIERETKDKIEEIARSLFAPRRGWGSVGLRSQWIRMPERRIQRPPGWVVKGIVLNYCAKICDEYGTIIPDEHRKDEYRAKGPTENLSLHFTGGQLTYVNKVCENNEITRTGLFRVAIRTHLKDLDREREGQETTRTSRRAQSRIMLKEQE